VRGDQGLEGPQGPQGNPGTVLVNNVFTGVGAPVDVLTPLGIGDSGPTSTDGESLVGDVFLTPGQYRVDVAVQFFNDATGDSDLEYGVGRLFLSGSPLDGASSSAGGGFSDVDTTIVTPDLPETNTNAAQASASYIITVGDDGSGGEILTLRGAVRSAEADGATASGHVIVSTFG
jgi:hypothetical protein